jgi:hypothetical protein
MPDHALLLLSDNDRFHCINKDYSDRVLSRAILKDHITQDDALLLSAFIAERKITNTILSQANRKN